MPVILSVSQSNATTDLNGVASLVPSGGAFSPPLEVDVTITAGTTARLDDPLEILPALTDANNFPPINPPPIVRLPLRMERAAEIHER